MLLHPLGEGAQIGDPEPALGPLRREEDEKSVASLVVHRQEVGGAHVASAELQEEVAGHGPDLLEGGRPVVMLDLRELRDVDEKEAHAALASQDVAQLGKPLPVRDGLGVGIGHRERAWREAGPGMSPRSGVGTAAAGAVAAPATRFRPCCFAS